MKGKQAAGWYVLGLLAAANFLHYANRNVVVTMYDDLREVFAFSNPQLGLLSTVFMLVHAPATIGFGWLSDRMDRRAILAGGAFIWSLASLGALMAEGIDGLLLSRALVGLGTAACVPVANALICEQLPSGKKARAVSVFNLGLFLGGAFGSFAGTKLGFPFAFVVLGAPGIAIGVLIAMLKLGPGERSLGLTGERKSNHQTLVALFRNKTFRWTIAGAVLMAFAAGSYLAWFFDFLQGSKGASENQALSILGVSLVTGLAGVLTGGIVADRFIQKRAYGRQAAVAIGMGFSVPMALLVIYIPLGISYYLFACLLMFFINWYHGPIAASVDDMVPPERAGLAQGIYISAMHLLGTAPSAWVVGQVAESVGLQTALLIPTAAMALASLCFVASFRSVKAFSG